MQKTLLLLCLLVLLGCQPKQHAETYPPLFAATLARTQVQVEGMMEQGFEVPVPKDMAGGHTHEVHKRNWKTLRDAGALFKLTGDERYAEFVRDGLLQYADKYKTWPKHPTNRSYATGRIFWQCLNDANWLVYVSQAYDDVYDWVGPDVQKQLNTELFRPAADFLSVENPQFFNRIHNHSTWANAAVGMIGLVMDDEELVQRALYGIPNDQLPAEMRDDDSGKILSKTGRAGFLAQLDLSFAPDGYFTEGPYYLRYALSPFLLFGRALAEKRPDLEVLEHRDGILGKAIYALLLEADPKGDFFPVNDSQKGMSLYSPEVVKSVDYGYYLYGRDASLLSIAAEQKAVTLDEAGLAVATDLEAGKATPFRPKSMAYTDGPNGDEGGLGILRAYSEGGEAQTALVMKYSAQGMGHGHFDKLSYSLYDGKGEIIQDYGAARWVNIDQKGGGRYLPENRTFAKESVAHNTLVVGQKSHYNGDIRIGEKYHPEPYAFVGEGNDLQLVSATSDNAYPGRKLQRAQWLLNAPEFDRPLVIDLFRARGTVAADHELPTWYMGQLLMTNFDYATEPTLRPLGEDNGYEHLHLEAAGKPTGQTAEIGWFNNGRFYTQTMAVRPGDEVRFVRPGAADPNFNLRRDPGFILRRPNVKSTTFASVLEGHGSYSPRDEVPLRPYGSITDVKILVDDEKYTALQFDNKNGNRWRLLFSAADNDLARDHSLTIDGQTYRWSGVHHLIKINASK